MHRLPVIMVGQVGGEPTTTLDGREQHNVEHGKEHAEVAPWRNPQLDIRHTVFIVVCAWRALTARSSRA